MNDREFILYIDRILFNIYDGNYRSLQSWHNRARAATKNIRDLIKIRLKEADKEEKRMVKDLKRIQKQLSNVTYQAPTNKQSSIDLVLDMLNDLIEDVNK